MRLKYPKQLSVPNPFSITLSLSLKKLSFIFYVHVPEMLIKPFNINIINKFAFVFYFNGRHSCRNVIENEKNEN